MTKDAPRDDFDDTELRVRPPQSSAAGVPGVVHGLRDVLDQAGVRRGVKTLRLLNQHRGFDCPGCAWPEPGKPHVAEFCENGAKAVAEETTVRRVGPDFFAAHPISLLATKTDHWLGQQGRLTAPVVRDIDSDHYRPIGWDDAFTMIADELRGMDSPDQAAFYTSGRTSNEAAFLYQLFARKLGTNNLPDCSNMCHESSGAALNETIGIGKGSVSLADITDHAELIVIVGQNPGTNHPRMLTALEQAKRRGARIVAINPLPEAGLRAFKNPQAVRGVVGKGTPLADLFLQIKVGGDHAFFQAVNAALVEADRATGDVLDHDFIDRYTSGFDDAAASWMELNDDDVRAATGLTARQIDEFVGEVVAARSVVVCWAMGLTQHKKSVPTIREIVNFLLLRGNIGRPGAGACPVRGHSNVQGDRTMGIWEKVPDAFLDRLGAEFRFEPPRAHGHDTVDTIRAMLAGRIRVFMAMGGNFAAATPDSDRTAAALRTIPLTVHVSTKLNRSHVLPGHRSLILPCLGRTEVDVQAGGEQFVTVEDSMSVVHASRGTLRPASGELRSEVAIICGLARAVLGDDDATPWERFNADYATVRERISRVIPGFERFEERVGEPGGFVLPHPPRDERRFATADGSARFTVNDLEVIRVPAGRLLLQTIRSHDQFNTTIYGLDDRYRGITNGRRVVFVCREDLDALGLADGTTVDLVSEWTDGERRAPSFRVVAYPTARGCAAAYYPETNPLVPLDHTAEVSNTPASKSVVVRLEPVTG
ncbi:FdhF/YdeP family oxidoreductase [Phytoactinopolyspora alkaliphila]|uniref:FdhF/YdeP family oxidoreductase n=1 Tax=Phytoactinopolyspora alkaliphila TaxID=1783498 RepID=A0A6N9YSZ4_9ACTN|nr:FdhF/YdeP family oxidoreductase [Phytoactinopolyspora alkaliphila]NED98094.1 FdhF/YdeP family oxidoreductase [Phytoactinopolyspora alkaliphila]